ncbi:MAG: hypothetical protein WC389_03645 [Lutibacter sp.]|jgi:hypothetical protein
MKVNDKELEEMQATFDQYFLGKGRLTKEKNKVFNSKGYWYEDGRINDLFKAYMLGCSHGAEVARKEYTNE